MKITELKMMSLFMFTVQIMILNEDLISQLKIEYNVHFSYFFQQFLSSKNKKHIGLFYKS